MSIGVGLAIMALCLAAEAFFSGSEIGVVSADRMKLRHNAANGSRGARLALKMLEEPEWLLSTTLIGTNIAVVTNTTVATALAIELLGERYSWVAIVVVAPLIWIFGEIVAKGVFQQRANELTPKVIFVLNAASRIFWPLLAVSTAITRFLTRVLGGEGDTTPFTLREEILSMMELPEARRDINAMEATMIRRVFDFGETTARDIITPLIDVDGIERNATCGHVKRLAVQRAHKRLTVYERRVDNVIGTVYALDMLRADDAEPITAHIRPPRYIPGSKSIEDLLREFRTSGDKVAVIVDEFGGAEGIVTLEDVLEEVVGDIEDEYDKGKKPRQWVRKLGERDYQLSARVELDQLKEATGIALPDGNYETVGGFLLEIAEEIPAEGAVLRHGAWTFQVERATPRAILSVRITW